MPYELIIFEKRNFANLEIPPILSIRDFPDLYWNRFGITDEQVGNFSIIVRMFNLIFENGNGSPFSKNAQL